MVVPRLVRLWLVMMWKACNNRMQEKCSQGIILGPLLFSSHINDITIDIGSELRYLADDCVVTMKSKIMKTRNFRQI